MVIEPSPSPARNREVLQAAFDEGGRVELVPGGWYPVSGPLHVGPSRLVQIDGWRSAVKFVDPDRSGFYFPALTTRVNARFAARGLRVVGSDRGTGLYFENANGVVLEDCDVERFDTGAAFVNVKRGWSESNFLNRVGLQRCDIGLLYEIEDGRRSFAGQKVTNLTASGVRTVVATQGEANLYRSSFTDFVFWFNRETPGGVGFELTGGCGTLRIQGDMENPQALAGDEGLVGVRFAVTCYDVASAQVDVGFVHRGWRVGDHVVNLTAETPLVRISDENRSVVY